MLDQDLAAIYRVSTKRLNEQVRRNLRRFPPDFGFQLSAREAGLMRSQFATASRRNIRHRPRAFTEHGIVMLAAVLNTDTAIAASVAIARAFIEYRRMAAETEGLADRVKNVEERLEVQEQQLRVVFEAFEAADSGGAEPAKEIGFLRHG